MFAFERGGPIAPKSFHKLIARLGARADMPFPIHPHMRRHACGYAGKCRTRQAEVQAWLSHRNIQHAVRYAEQARPAGQDRPASF